MNDPEQDNFAYKSLHPPCDIHESCLEGTEYSCGEYCRLFAPESESNWDNNEQNIWVPNIHAL